MFARTVPSHRDPAQPRRRRNLLVPAVVAVTLVSVALTGCAATVALDPAADATDPGCAQVMVRLPTTVGDDQSQRETNAQATSAWGSPASVLLRCGVTPPGPTTLPCINILPPGGTSVDWIEDDSQKPSYTYTTFGRTPATQVVVDSNAVSATTVLTDLNTAISAIRATAECTAPDDILGTGGSTSGSTMTPAPSPLPTQAPVDPLAPETPTSPTQFATDAPSN
ncbi:DUF3515 family protein [Subtercola sp. YIM 133946]|uniref:DUF3515 family protein n=1 Tax=Subtercola sp. YIM 133946 TaxID=3118909 RepID=UPI002F94A0A4